MGRLNAGFDMLDSKVKKCAHYLYFIKINKILNVNDTIKCFKGNCNERYPKQ